MKYFLPAEEWDKLPDSLPSAEMSLKTKNEERKCKGFRNGSLRRKNIGEFFFVFKQKFRQINFYTNLIGTIRPVPVYHSVEKYYKT